MFATVQFKEEKVTRSDNKSRSSDNEPTTPASSRVPVTIDWIVLDDWEGGRRRGEESLEADH